MTESWLPSSWLPSSPPEAQGISSTAIEAFLDTAEERDLGLHSLVLIRHGQVVAQGWWEPYRAELPHTLFSISKSFTSAAVGLAVAEGRLSIDDLVLPYFPDVAPKAVGENLATMRVRHLLTMTTGHAADVTEQVERRADGDWVAGCLEYPVEHEPGTFFAYNNGATYLLSAILQRLTGQTVLDYLRPRLLEPLGVTDATWSTCPRGITIGAWGLNLRTLEVARFGQLCLNGGVGPSSRLLPADWVAAATAKQVRNDNRESTVDWTQGYGYQFWRCRHDAYRGDGAFGQFCVVLPERDAVLVMTGGMSQMQPVLDLVWERILPALADAPLPADPPAARRLADRLSSLRLPPVRGGAAPAAGVLGRTYAVAPEQAALWSAPTRQRGWPTPDRVTVDAGSPGWTLDLGDRPLPCGDSEWRTTAGPDGSTPIAATGGWLDAATFQAKVCYPTMPFIRTLTLRYAGDELTATAQDNCSFGPTDHPPLVARAI